MEYLLPASRGDVAAAAEAYDAIVLIDGVFHHDLAPSPKECLAACRRVPMIGAASMGALRAAECWPYGLRPVGAIARWYIHEVIDGDDEVAVLVHPESHRALTVPSVNVRYVAWLARRRGLLTAAESDAFITGARSVYYMERSWDTALEHAPSAARHLLGAIAHNEGDLKRWDARATLRYLSRNERFAGGGPIVA
ncbi:MAG: TfuA-related McrA-glycine thioamidation protein [bacterium]|nr:TfuA-related McrA-glycine thioamidation protein [bacterium]